MSFTFPPLVVEFDDGERLDVQIRRIDLVRLERAEKISTARMDLGLDQLYKLAWMALQRDRHPRVAPHHDLGQVSSATLCAGADALVESASVEVGGDEVESGKDSDPAPSTGSS